MAKGSDKVAGFVGKWGKQFFLAGSAVVSAVVMANVGVAKFVGKLVEADDELEEFARQNGMTRDEAFKTKSALDAMGKSLEEIQANPHLLQQYRELRENAESLKPPDLSEGLNQVRSIIGEFTKLKQIGSAALQWIGHYTLKYIARPLEQVNEKMGGINKTLTKNLPAWSEKIGMALSWIVRLGMTVIRGAGAVFNAIKKIFDMIPGQVKIAMGALAGLALFIRAGPIGKLITILSIALLLLEDFFTYLDGGDSLLGPVWKTLIDLFSGFTEGGEDALGFITGEFLPGILDAILKYIPPILNAGTKILLSLIDGIVAALPYLVDAAIDLMENLLATFMDNFPMLMDAGLNLVMSLIQGIVNSLPDIIKAAVKLLDSLLKAILSNLPTIIQAGIDLVLALISGIFDALPDIVMAALELLTTIHSTIFENLPQIIEAGVKILVSLLEGIWSLQERIRETAVNIILKLFEGFKQMSDRTKESGRKFVTNLWEGILSMGDWLKEKIGGWFGGIVDGVKDFFGGGGDPSPSTGGGMPGHAEGGIFSREHVARFAEGNEPEAVVPLNKPSRAREVMGQIGRYLGGSAPSLESVEKMAASVYTFMERATSMLTKFDATLNAGAVAAAAAGGGNITYNNQKYDLRSSTNVQTSSDKPQEVAAAVDRTQQMTIRNLKDVIE